MAASPLCDGKRFAANLMTVLRDIWQQWVDRPDTRFVACGRSPG
jgi:hypothetical protein